MISRLRVQHFLALLLLLLHRIKSDICTFTIVEKFSLNILHGVTILLLPTLLAYVPIKYRWLGSIVTAQCG